MAAERFLTVIVVLFAALPFAAAQPPLSHDMKSVERGRYLAKIAGCNDCHTPGYAQMDGKVPEKLWLTGDQLGCLGAGKELERLGG